MSLTEQPCVVQNMKDGGVVPKSKLSVTELNISNNKVLIVKSPSAHGDTPTWISVTFTAGDVSKITVVPVDKNSKPVGAPKEDTPDSTKPTTAHTVTLDHPTVADHLYIVLVSSKPTEKTHVDILSVLSCMPDEGSNCLIVSCL